MEGRREFSRNGKKSLNCTSIGWNTLILSFAPFRNIRYYRQIDKVRILKAVTRDILICPFLSCRRISRNLRRICYTA